MPLRNRPEHWGAISIALHWLTFVLILGQAAIGLLMTEMPNGVFKIQVYSLHKSFGLTVLALTILRLSWRLLDRAPAAIGNMAAWQEKLARFVQAGLYALLLAVPLTGWWFNSASGFPLRWFGLFKLPRLTGYDPDIKALARESHETLFYLMAGLLLIHAMAALWHHFKLHDRTLLRMLPPSRTPSDHS